MKIKKLEIDSLPKGVRLFIGAVYLHKIMYSEAIDPLGLYDVRTLRSRSQILRANKR